LPEGKKKKCKNARKFFFPTKPKIGKNTKTNDTVRTVLEHVLLTFVLRLFKLFVTYHLRVTPPLRLEICLFNEVHTVIFKYVDSVVEIKKRFSAKISTKIFRAIFEQTFDFRPKFRFFSEKKTIRCALFFAFCPKNKICTKVPSC